MAQRRVGDAQLSRRIREAELLGDGDKGQEVAGGAALIAPAHKSMLFLAANRGRRTGLHQLRPAGGAVRPCAIRTQTAPNNGHSELLKRSEINARDCHAQGARLRNETGPR